jgi:tetratricopeptide (TPR) repeat protein
VSQRGGKAPAVAAPRAPLAVAMIAYNAEKTLGTCLASIAPHVRQLVVCVDERTTDKTAKIARSFGAEVHPVKVSDWHECPDHGRVLAQHFADARNESFKYLDPSIPFWMWLDSDDIVKGADRLPDLLAAVPEDHLGLWCDYHYATMNGGAQTSTLFMRERIFRASVGWEWAYRVHEVCNPKRPGPWLSCKDVAIYHQEGAHKTDNSAARNTLLLEIDAEEETARDGLPSSRTLFYLGNQHFAQNQFEEAARWYAALAERREGAGGAPVNVYELWQGLCYQAIAYERLGRLDDAMVAAWNALDAVPNHPEPYYRLAALYALMGEHGKAQFWTAMGRQQPEPPFFVFKNPLDYTFNARLPLADSLAAQGRVREAREELEQAYAAFPAEQIGEAITRYKTIEGQVAEGERFKQFAEYAGADQALVTVRYDALPAEVKSIRSVRDVVMPAWLANRPSTQPRIVFWCGRAMEPWAPPKLNETGIGGSETAVVEIARRFARDGWRVDVYNSPGPYEGLHDGVGYWEPERYRRAMRATSSCLGGSRMPGASGAGHRTLIAPPSSGAMI